MPASTSSDKATVMRCSFCNKDQDTVRYLIAGPNVFICDECVEACGEIIKQSQEGSSSTDPAVREVPPGAAAPVFCALCSLPVASTDVLLVENRGILCRVCVEAVEAARRPS